MKKVLGGFGLEVVEKVGRLLYTLQVTNVSRMVGCLPFLPFSMDSGIL
jgi:hypothetical protein